MISKNPSGVPGRVMPERIIPRDGAVEQEWWLRNNERHRLRDDPPFTYYSHNSLKKNNFQAGAMEEDHSRRVFKELAKQGHSFSESNLQALKQDREIRKSMQKRYFEVMGQPSKPPGPTKSFLRSQDPQPAQVEKAPPGAVAAPAPLLAASAPRDMASIVSANPPRDKASMVSANMAASMVGSQLSRAALSTMTASNAGGVPPALGSTVGRASSVAKLASSDAKILSEEREAADPTVSQLSKSDFYAWRPRMLR
jgi:hypothetical protein